MSSKGEEGASTADVPAADVPAAAAAETAATEAVAEEKCVDILGLYPPEMRYYHRCELNFEVWSLNNGYLATNVIIDRFFQLHSYIPAIWSGQNFWQQDDIYNALGKKVYVHPDCPHPKLRDDLKINYDFSIIERFGGSKNFQQTMSYLIAQAVEEGFTTIHLHGIWLIAQEEFFGQIPSLIGILNFILDRHPNVKISVFPPEIAQIWRLEAATLPPTPDDYPPYHEWESPHMKNDWIPGITKEQAMEYYPVGVGPSEFDKEKRKEEVKRLYERCLLSHKHGRSLLYGKSKDEYENRVKNMERNMKYREQSAPKKG